MILTTFNKFTFKGNSFQEEVDPKPKLGMFCVLSQNNQRWFEKQIISILKQIVWKLESYIKFQWTQELFEQIKLNQLNQVLELLIKTLFITI